MTHSPLAVACVRILSPHIWKSHYGASSSRSSFSATLQSPRFLYRPYPQTLVPLLSARAGNLRGAAALCPLPPSPWRWRRAVSVTRSGEVSGSVCRCSRGGVHTRGLRLPWFRQVRSIEINCEGMRLTDKYLFFKSRQRSSC